MRSLPSHIIEDQSLDVFFSLLTLDFNINEFYMYFSGQRLSTEDIFLRELSIILIDPL